MAASPAETSGAAAPGDGKTCPNDRSSAVAFCPAKNFSTVGTQEASKPLSTRNRMVTFDPSYEPLAWFKACRHLELKATTPIENRWYGACAIGDAAARDRWTQSIGA